VNSQRLPQLLKHDPEIVVIDEGMHIDSRDEQSKNHRCPRIEIWESDSNLTEERDEQPSKQAVEIVRTLFGIVTSRSVPKYRNR
jgi:hypothetical protein